MATCSLTGDKDISVGLETSKDGSSDILPERRFEDSLEVDAPDVNGRMGNFYSFTYNSETTHPPATTYSLTKDYCLQKNCSKTSGQLRWIHTWLNYS